MNEKTHAYLERFHYKAVREHPQYRLQGQMECLQEEMMMAMPLAPLPFEAKPIIEQKTFKVYTSIDKQSLELDKRIAQNTGKIHTLIRELNNHLDAIGKYTRSKRKPDKL